MRIQVKPLQQYPWYLRPFFWHQKRKYGQVLQPALIWARVPVLFSAVAILYGILDRKRSPLSPILRSLVIVRISQINWCQFCIDLNAYTLTQLEGSIDKVEALTHWKQSNLFDEQEKTVLEYTDAVTYTDQKVTDELMQRLSKFLDADAIVELTALIAFQNMSSKFNSAVDAPSQGFCQTPGIEK